jgi:Ca2+/Na+ antiporter
MKFYFKYIPFIKRYIYRILSIYLFFFFLFFILVFLILLKYKVLGLISVFILCLIIYRYFKVNYNAAKIYLNKLEIDHELIEVEFWVLNKGPFINFFKKEEGWKVDFYGDLINSFGGPKIFVYNEKEKKKFYIPMNTTRDILEDISSQVEKTKNYN